MGELRNAADVVNFYASLTVAGGQHYDGHGFRKFAAQMVENALRENANDSGTEPEISTAVQGYLFRGMDSASFYYLMGNLAEQIADKSPESEMLKQIFEKGFEFMKYAPHLKGNLGSILHHASTAGLDLHPEVKAPSNQPASTIDPFPSSGAIQREM